MKFSKQSRKFNNNGNRDAEVCWWIEEANVQWRFSGEVDLYSGDEEERQRLWNQMSEGGKGQFLCPQAAGELQKSPSEMRNKQVEKLNSCSGQTVMEEPMGDFLVGVLRCVEVDMLDLSTLERKNWVHTAAKGYILRADGYAVPVVSTVK